MDRAKVLQRQAVATELRSKGHEYAEIARIVGYASKSGAWHAVQRALKQRSSVAADHLVQRSFLELDVLQAKVWPAAMAGSPRATGQCLRIMNRRIELVDQFGSRLDSELARERAADAADAYLAAMGLNACVSRDPALVFESRDVFAFVRVDGINDGSSISVQKNGRNVRMVAPPTSTRSDAPSGDAGATRRNSRLTVDWALLRDSHGSAEEIPALLAVAERSADDSRDWELVNHLLYRDNRVFTASYAALPFLAEIAARRVPGPRNPATKLAATILDATDRPAMDEDPRITHADAVGALLTAAERDSGYVSERDDAIWSAFICETFGSALRFANAASMQIHHGWTGERRKSSDFSNDSHMIF